MFWQCTALFTTICSAIPQPGALPQRNPVFSGKVIEVMEGDLFKVRTKDWGDYTVRFWGVDAPELDQPFGKAAKDHLKSMILEKTVTVDVYARQNGAKGLQFGWVRVGDSRKFNIVNEIMVTDGFAWCEPIAGNGEVKEAMDLLGKAEQEARRSRAGLWSKFNPIAPWEWKRRGMGSADTLFSNLLEPGR